MTSSPLPNGSSKYRAPALDKGLDILELLAERDDGLTQKQIANRLGRSVNEIFRMLSVLKERRYVELRSDGDRYVLSTKLFALSHRHPPMKRLVNAGMPRLRSVAEKTRQSCHLGTFHQGALLIVAQVDSPESVGYHVDAGATFDFFETSSAHVLLAFNSPTEQERMLRDVPAPALARVDREVLEERLQSIRTNGYEARDSDVVRAVRNIAVPIFGFSGNAVATLTVPYLFKMTGYDQPSPEEAQEVASAAGRDLSQAIGAPEDIEDAWRQAAPLPYIPADTGFSR